MSSTLDAAKAAHPVGKAVRFKVPGRGGLREHSGTVSDHVSGSKGPFVVIQKPDGSTARARPAHVSDA